MKEMKEQNVVDLAIPRKKSQINTLFMIGYMKEHDGEEETLEFVRAFMDEKRRITDEGKNYFTKVHPEVLKEKKAPVYTTALDEALSVFGLVL